MTPCIIITHSDLPLYAAAECLAPHPPFDIYRASQEKERERGNTKKDYYYYLLVCLTWCTDEDDESNFLFLWPFCRVVFPPRNVQPYFIHCNSKIKFNLKSKNGGKNDPMNMRKNCRCRMSSPPLANPPSLFLNFLISCCCYSWQHIRRRCQDNHHPPRYPNEKKTKYECDVHLYTSIPKCYRPTWKNHSFEIAKMYTNRSFLSACLSKQKSYIYINI